MKVEFKWGTLTTCLDGGMIVGANNKTGDLETRQVLVKDNDSVL